MCYVIEEKQPDGESVGKCWFHDKETAQEIMDYLEMKYFDKDFELLSVPLAYAREYDVPYCIDFCVAEGITVA